LEKRTKKWEKKRELVSNPAVKGSTPLTGVESDEIWRASSCWKGQKSKKENKKKANR